MNRKCARFKKPMSCFEMRLCCRQPSSWKKQFPILAPLEMLLFSAVFAPFSPPLQGCLPADRPGSPPRPAKGGSDSGLGSPGDVHPSPDVTNGTIPSEKQKLVKPPQLQGKILSFSDGNQ